MTSQAAPLGWGAQERNEGYHERGHSVTKQRAWRDGAE